MSAKSHPDAADLVVQRSRRRLWYRLACYTLLPYAVISGMLAYLQRTLIYLPDRSPAVASETGYPPEQLTEITRVTEDGLTLRGWFITADDSPPFSEKLPDDDPHPLVLYFPGNGGHRGYRLKEIRQLTSLDCHVLYFDYRGYAANPGKPTEADLARDARGVWSYAVNTLGARPEQIVVWGESLGGGVATGLAYELCGDGANPGGLILRCTFTSLADAGAYHYPWLPVRLVLLDRYPSIERIPHVTCPLLVMHGQQDRIVPFEHGEKLFHAAPSNSHCGVPKRFVALPDAGHNDMMYVAAEDIRSAVQQFLESVEAPANPATNKPSVQSTSGL